MFSKTSTSLVSQICKNDDGVSTSNEKDTFYSELIAKIYCFKDAFRADSGNSENFKFDQLSKRTTNSYIQSNIILYSILILISLNKKNS
jgi:hypothetical protein